ncbi:MAG: hypothetical protein RL264_1042 [Bacteroidota bacterium]|jgi:dipeptidyl-peptidase-4
MKKIIASLSFILFIGISAFSQLKELTLKDAIMMQNRSLAPERLNNFQWIPGTNSYSFASKNYQTIFKSTTNSTKDEELLQLQDVNTKISTQFVGFMGMSWLDQNTILLNNGITIAEYNLVTKSGKKWHTFDEGIENVTLHKASKNVAYTIQNNVYLRKADGKQIEVTNFTDKNVVSGHSISRNEFGISEGLFWSPKGDFLAFYQKDETNVANYPLLNINDLPGSLTNIKYPMAGQTSEHPRVGIYNTLNGNLVYIEPQGAKDDYLTNLSFTPDNQYLLLAELNRDQNQMKLNVYEVATGKFVRTLLEESNDKWVEPEHAAFFPSATSNNFIWISEKSGFNNLYYYDFSGKLIAQLTNHNFVVKEIIGTNKQGNVIFYKATGENPTNTLTYFVDLKKYKNQLITTKEGTHNTVISEDGSLIFDAYSSGSVAYESNIIAADGKLVKAIMTSRDKLLDFKMGTAEIGKLKAKDGSDLYYRLIKPSNFDASKKYPVLVYVYGGPHAQMITNSWLNGANLWMYWMAEQGYLVFTLDNRGSAERGFAFESQIHRQLGNVEMEDQLTGVAFLKSLNYVDANRLAVHGWSFGGFMTTSLMLRQPGTFKVGVAGGPVTDWKFYEVMYGERYMDRPEQNKEGYEKSSLLNYTQNLKGDLLLIHGTIDDVVVMQHNYALVKKFVENGVQMDFFPYPMHKHNVTGKDRVHLMEKVLTYILKNNQ